MPLQAVIMPTYSKNEKYIDLCIKAMDAFWVAHPPIWVLSDRGRYKYQNSIIIKSPHWVEVLKKGIEELLERNILKDDDYILLLHEDHIPIRNVPEEIIVSFTDCAVRRGLKFVSLSGHGGKVKIDEIEGIGLFRIADDFQYYSEHHPAIWHIGHLLNILEKAMLFNCLSPWESEYIKIPNVVHYTIGEYKPENYIWPSSFSGFLKYGRVNIKAVRKMKSRQLGVLKRMLMADWIIQMPGYFFCRLKRKVKKVFSGYYSKNS